MSPTLPPTPLPGLGMVVIGRNEGERLTRCLQSCLCDGVPLVYVDSASTDDSIERAQALGAQVLRLDMARPFSAARARNEGLQALLADHPALAVVQLLDGDCVLDPGWLAPGLAALAGDARLAAVCGRRRERFPEASLYNALADIEWNTPVGEARAFGGDVLLRVQAWREVGGYRDGLIAGEEPELALRLRRAGWRIQRLGVDMSWHDAALLHWRQWWRRSLRAGHAFAEGAWLHGRGPERHYVRETGRALAWAGLLPVLVAALLVASATWATAAACLLLLLYPVQWLRVGWRLRRAGQPLPWAQSAFFLQGRFAELAGALRFAAGRLMHRPPAIIEYK